MEHIIEKNIFIMLKENHWDWKHKGWYSLCMCCGDLCFWIKNILGRAKIRYGNFSVFKWTTCTCWHEVLLVVMYKQYVLELFQSNGYSDLIKLYIFWIWNFDSYGIMHGSWNG